jgi:hypothetical protein
MNLSFSFPLDFLKAFNYYFCIFLIHHLVLIILYHFNLVNQLITLLKSIIKLNLFNFKG